MGKPRKHRLVAVANMEGCVDCHVCGAAEGELPTDCPGRRMSEAERYSVLHGELDYRNGVWSVLEDTDE